MKNKLIDVSIKTMVGQLPDIITKNNESINKEFANIYEPGVYDPETDRTGHDRLIIYEVDTTNGGKQDGLVKTTNIECYSISLEKIEFQGNEHRIWESKRDIVKDVSHNFLLGRYLWKPGNIVSPIPDVSLDPDMKSFCHNAGAIGIQMGDGQIFPLSKVINDMIDDIDSMKSTYHGLGTDIYNGDGYVNIYGAPNTRTASDPLSEPDSFTFDNNLLFSTKTQLKRMNLPVYQYNDLTSGFIYTYYNYNNVITISDEHTASISGIPGSTVTIRFNDLKKKAYYRVILSRKENKFLRISKDELVRLQLVCVNNSDEFGAEWDVNTYSVRNADDLVIERK